MDAAHVCRRVGVSNVDFKVSDAAQEVVGIEVPKLHESTQLQNISS
jgi:hypothetical protein